MLFTLSLPISRRRLFFARTGLGALESCAYVVCTTGLTLFFRPEATSLFQAIRYGARAIVCTMALYAFSAFLACVLDEMWQFTGGCLILCGVWLLETRFAALANFSPLRGLSLVSFPLAALTPWTPVLTSVAVTGIFFFASVQVLQRKEY
jgi:hypothetical protein